MATYKQIQDWIKQQYRIQSQNLLDCSREILVRPAHAQFILQESHRTD